MPVPTKNRPSWRNRLSTSAFSRNTSRTGPSRAIRYTEFSPLAGTEGAGAGDPFSVPLRDASVLVLVAAPFGLGLPELPEARLMPPAENPAPPRGALVVPRRLGALVPTYSDPPAS